MAAPIHLGIALNAVTQVYTTHATNIVYTSIVQFQEDVSTFTDKMMAYLVRLGEYTMP